MSIFKKKQKKKRSDGMFERIEIGGRTVPVAQFYMYVEKSSGTRFIELAALEEIPEFHFTEVEFDAVLSEKRLHIKASFSDAYEKARYKVYKFTVSDVSVFFI